MGDLRCDVCGRPWGDSVPTNDGMKWCPGCPGLAVPPGPPTSCPRLGAPCPHPGKCETRCVHAYAADVKR